MEIALERGNGCGPVYRQIADQIQALIRRGRLAAGERLPPIRQLAQDLGVNRDTVALAYEALVGAGAAESSVGRGTFVAPASGPVAAPEPFLPTLSPLAERVLEFDRSRPHFGSGADAVPMHSLVPDASLYPADEFRRSLNRVLLEGGSDLLRYGGPQGHPGLREVLRERFGREGVSVTADEIVLCHGASQGISLALRLFAQTGDVVALEEPTYSNVLAAAYGLGIRTAAIPMRDDGPDLVVLERTLARPEVRALYTIPSFHNPLGTTTTVEHRRALLAVAARCGKPVIEDGYEMDLRFAGRAVPPLAALDDTGLVLQLFSFSKSLFPGARVGAIAARGRAVDALVALKQATDLSDALPLQAALADFAGSGAYDRHLVRTRKVLRRRCQALVEALAEHMPAGTRWTQPEGGLQMWVELPEGMETRDLLADAARAGVLFAPGSQFQHDGRPSRGLRLTFAMADEAALRVGVATLGRVVEARRSGARRAEPRVHV